ncbi:MAG: penicillin-binding transpeptidase domain-containing protein [Hespellia sp.]|nr:penicillin-binding transpeptidase domain-containing protein [Hespellia sp.]
MSYIVYFNVVKGKEIVNSPYNTRQDSFADRVVRGHIVDASGNILAETAVAEDGTETRSYPYGAEFAHVVGYSTQGKSGLESVENFNLLTSNAFFIEKIKNTFQNVKNQGDTVVTTLNETLQSAAYNAMGDNKGAVMVMEASTGKILAMVSAPSYDPNSVEENWDYLNSEESGSALLNRVTQGSYAPGSTFKVVTALEYMRENADYGSYQYDCAGEITNDGTTIHCFDYTVHGLQDLRSSMANSCNSSFANIGLSLNRTSYAETAKELLFNSKLPCELDYSKSSFKVAEDTNTAEMMMTAMGQGQTLVSPYHMALITAAIANGGTLMNPYLVSQVTNYAGTEVSSTKPSAYGQLMTSTEAAQLKEYMAAVVSEGTATALSGQSYSVAGKTGTAEYSSESDSNMDHSWFIGFTNVDNPELVISVVVEGSDGESTAKAVPIAKQVLDAYYY